ncbi:MAG: acetyl-CoA carboxylase biotin carboxylase subunit [Proteobacteria bacterium]|nr:acetyl-CoA carboxylase biotin carboxylase subunit [Burkholderiales bacterium]
MRKVLVANRGEIACRVIRSCRTLGLAVATVHSEADANARHVALADQSVLIGPAPATQSYLLAERVLAAARETDSDAVHPGYGFLSENAQFARAVEAAGLRWIGPDPKSIDDMGDKECARRLARTAGVPVLPGSERFSPEAVAGLEAAGVDVGYPLLVKAAAGGGGIGMRRVDRAEDLAAAVTATQSMAARAFGDGTIYLERFIDEARHVEVQVFGFGDGRGVHVHERDCSVQRRFQKVVEESPAPGVDAATRAAMFEASVRLVEQENYRGAGTIEFVVDARTRQFFFLEMNTRIQVEHPVTEMNTGLDLVAMQILLAAGAPLPLATQTGVTPHGHTIECRIYAERPAKNFLPSTGTLTRFALPAQDAGLRIDTGVHEGDPVTHFYDPMIAKVIAHADDRPAALATMQAALAASRIEGVETNLAFLQRVLAHPEFVAGRATTRFIERFKAELLTS